MFKSKKGQIALEVLVIFGVLVIGSIIFGLFYMNNIKDILVEGPGTKQDKNGGGDVYDDLEGSLIYNEEQQIGSSSHGITGGSGGTGGTDDPEDPPVPYCGDGECNGTETITSCSRDCSAGYYFNSLELEILPEDIAYTTDKITITATLESDAPSAQISEINIQKYNWDLSEFSNSSDCGLVDYDNNSSYFNVGELLPSYPGFLTDSFDFICDVGLYKFTFYLNTGTETIENEGYKEVTEPEPQILPTILVFDTTKDGYYGNPRDITLPLDPDGTFAFEVDWGDGGKEIDYITSWDDPKKVHTYSTPGVYTVTINGTLDGFNYSNINYDHKNLELIEIAQWGELRLGNNGRYFYSCNFEISATDVLNSPGTTNMTDAFAETNIIYNSSINEWDMSNVTDMTRMFYRAYNFNAPIYNWDTSNVANMSEMFLFNESFNQPIGNWDVSNVTDMSNMFLYALSFNQPLNNWNVSKVVNFQSMFEGASSFNQPLDNWNTSSSMNMGNMFSGASSFNQSLNNWNVSRVTDMSNMFSSASSFNQSLNNWNVSGVTDMSSMFSGASSFNQNINNWNVSKVTDMSGMFGGASSFNQPLDNWDTSSVEIIAYMFSGASSFNQPIGNWDTSNVINMSAVFSNAINFNQSLSAWNTTNVNSMSGMFYNATSFNQAINGGSCQYIHKGKSYCSWDVSNVTDMSYMFYNASSFNRALSLWNVSSVTTMESMFQEASTFNQNISNWNVNNVTTWYAIFTNCPIYPDYKPPKFR